MFRIAICDDESYFRKRIRDILIDYMEKNGFRYEIDEFESGKEFVDLGIGMVKYTVIFLDINMDEMDGIKAAEKIRTVSKDIFIVFVTAFVHYAVAGYKVEAVRYLLKNNVNFPEQVMECIEAINRKMNYVVKRKEFDFSNGKKNVSLEYILYIESHLHKLDFYIMEEKLNKYSLYEKLDIIEKELGESDFIRIHKSYLVNMRYIEKVSRYEVLLNNGIKLKIPKARYKLVEEDFATYKGEI